jgi:hypothetical protein
VYLDSSTLSDLRTLFTEGVHKSDCIVLLATKVPTACRVEPACPFRLYHIFHHGSSPVDSSDTLMMTIPATPVSPFWPVAPVRCARAPSRERLGVSLRAAQGVLTRPWCLLELLEAKRMGVPILPIGLTGLTLDLPSMRNFIDNAEFHLGKSNPSALELLNEHEGNDLTELKQAAFVRLGAHAPIRSTAHRARIDAPP